MQINKVIVIFYFHLVQIDNYWYICQIISITIKQTDTSVYKMSRDK